MSAHRLKPGDKPPLLPAPSSTAAFNLLADNVLYPGMKEVAKAAKPPEASNRPGDNSVVYIFRDVHPFAPALCGNLESVEALGSLAHHAVHAKQALDASLTSRCAN